MLRRAAGALLASANASLLTLAAERSLHRSLPQAVASVSHLVSSSAATAGPSWRQNGAIRSFSERSVAARRLEEAEPRRRRALVRRSDDSPTAEQPEQEVVSPSETPASELQIRQVIDHPALIITRPIEWGTVLLGYEQANKYEVYDQDGTLVALIAEDVTGIGNAIGRQVLRTRRSFTATVFNATGEQVLFRVRRPAYLINSSMFIEDGEERVIGEVQQRWHLYKRTYDLYLDRRQFARIEGGFLAWEFELKDAQGGTLALIDRNFQGFGKELFTDAGKYCIHFGFQPDAAAHIATETLRARSGRADAPEVPALPQAGAAGGPAAGGGKELAVIPTTAANQLVVARPLALEERLVALAAAISIDYNYFSQHSSHGSGWLAPPLFFPGGGGGGAGAGEATEAGADAAGASGAAGAAGAGAEGAADDAGTAGASDFGGGNSGGEGSFGGEQGLGGDAFPGGGDSSGGTGSWQNDDEIKWDLPDSAGDGGDGEGGVMGAIKNLWEVFNGD